MSALATHTGATSPALNPKTVTLKGATNFPASIHCPWLTSAELRIVCDTRLATETLVGVARACALGVKVKVEFLELNQLLRSMA